LASFALRPKLNIDFLLMLPFETLSDRSCGFPISLVWASGASCAEASGCCWICAMWKEMFSSLLEKLVPFRLPSGGGTKQEGESRDDEDNSPSSTPPRTGGGRSEGPRAPWAAALPAALPTVADPPRTGGGSPTGAREPVVDFLMGGCGTGCGVVPECGERDGGRESGSEGTDSADVVGVATLPTTGGGGWKALVFGGGTGALRAATGGGGNVFVFPSLMLFCSSSRPSCAGRGRAGAWGASLSEVRATEREEGRKECVEDLLRAKQNDG